MSSSNTPLAPDSVISVTLRRQPVQYDFNDDHFSVKLESRLTAVISKLPDLNGRELVSHWIGVITSFRSRGGKKPEEVPVFVTEYLHLPAEAAERAPPSADGEGPHPSKFSTAMKEYEAYCEAQQDGYFLTPDHLLQYGAPFSLCRRSFRDCTYHALVFKERQDDDRIVTAATIKAKTEALEDIKLDLGERGLSQNGPFIERQDSVGDPSYLALQLYPADVPENGILRELPTEFAARNVSESKRWFSGVLALELPCQRKQPALAARIWQWIEPLTKRAHGNEERKDRLQRFKKDLEREARRAGTGQKSALMTQWDKLAKVTPDPVHEWLEPAVKQALEG